MSEQGLDGETGHVMPAQRPSERLSAEQLYRLREMFAVELRKYWSFNDGQRHTHTWHSREDFIEQKLPALVRAVVDAVGEVLP